MTDIVVIIGHIGTETLYSLSVDMKGGWLERERERERERKLQVNLNLTLHVLRTPLILM